MACTNPKAALGSFVNWFFRNWLELDEDHERDSMPCCESPETSRQPMFLHCFCSTLWNSWCLFHQHIPHLETFTTSHPPSLAPPSLQTHEHCAPRLKPSPNNVKERLRVVLRGGRCFHLKSRRKLHPCSHVTALMEVLSHFALNFKQDRLLKPWYLRFDFLNISLLLKRVLPYQRIARGGNSPSPVFALECTQPTKSLQQCCNHN